MDQIVARSVTAKITRNVVRTTVSASAIQAGWEIGATKFAQRDSTGITVWSRVTVPPVTLCATQPEDACVVWDITGTNATNLEPKRKCTNRKMVSSQ